MEALCPISVVPISPMAYKVWIFSHSPSSLSPSQNNTLVSKPSIGKELQPLSISASEARKTHNGWRSRCFSIPGRTGSACMTEGRSELPSRWTTTQPNQLSRAYDPTHTDGSDGRDAIMSGEGPCRSKSTLISVNESDEAQTSVSNADGYKGGQLSIENRTLHTPLVLEIYNRSSHPPFLRRHHSSDPYLAEVQPSPVTDRGTRPTLPERRAEVAARNSVSASLEDTIIGPNSAADSQCPLLTYQQSELLKRYRQRARARQGSHTSNALSGLAPFPWQVSKTDHHLPSYRQSQRVDGSLPPYSSAWLDLLGGMGSSLGLADNRTLGQSEEELRRRLHRYVVARERGTVTTNTGGLVPTLEKEETGSRDSTATLQSDWSPESGDR